MKIFVVIPCHNEPHLLETMDSLWRCEAPMPVEIVVVINQSEKASPKIRQQNEKSRQMLHDWIDAHQKSNWTYRVFWEPQLPSKFAGVGLARKIGLDYACNQSLEQNAPRNILVCLDADTLVETHYFTAIAKGFRRHPKLDACSIAYAHPLEGSRYPSEVYEAIIRYELHLRYFLEAKRWTGFPFAIETIGSAMAVTAKGYRKQGGMNRRKAGEDFYFLQKYIEAGSCFVLNDTSVHPAPRASDRVPFGTGKAVGQYLANSSPTFSTYHPKSFLQLKPLFDAVDDMAAWKETDFSPFLEQLPEEIRTFLHQRDGAAQIKAIRAHTASPKAFRKRFFRWFNAFMLMKYVHFVRDSFNPDLPVEVAADWLIEAAFDRDAQHWLPKEKLLFLREMQNS